LKSTHFRWFNKNFKAVKTVVYTQQQLKKFELLLRPTYHLISNSRHKVICKPNLADELSHQDCREKNLEQ